MRLLADEILLGDDLTLSKLPKLTSRERLDYSRQLVQTVIEMEDYKLGEITPYNIVTGISPENPSRRILAIV